VFRFFGLGFNQVNKTEKVRELLELDPTFEQVMENEYVLDEFKKGNDQLAN